MIQDICSQEFSQELSTTSKVALAGIDIPKDIVKEILQKLESARDIARCAGVCRSWRVLAREPEVVMAVLRRIEGLTFFDDADWREHFVLPEGVSFDDLPPFNPVTALPTIHRHLSLSIEGDAGVTLLTLPRGLTFNTLVELANAPRLREGMKFSFIWDSFTEAHGDDALSSTKRIVITNNVLNETRSKSAADEKVLVKDLGCHLPHTLEAAALCTTTFIATGVRLYNDSPWTYTHCEENVRGIQIIVGGLSAAGLKVSNSIYDCWDDDNFGAGAASEVL